MVINFGVLFATNRNELDLDGLGMDLNQFKGTKAGFLFVRFQKNSRRKKLKLPKKLKEFLPKTRPIGGILPKNQAKI